MANTGESGDKAFQNTDYNRVKNKQRVFRSRPRSEKAYRGTLWLMLELIWKELRPRAEESFVQGFLDLAGYDSFLRKTNFLPALQLVRFFRFISCPISTSIRRIFLEK